MINIMSLRLTCRKAILAMRFVMVIAASLTLIFPPHIMQAYAQSITADPTAPQSMQPTIGVAPNGVPLMDIVAPNQSGLSPNRVDVFNVKDKGAILNNSQDVARSQLGGIVPGNPNLKDGAATAVLIEGNATNQMHLGGPLEMHGQEADLILATPAGIIVNGASFINAPRVTLTTGTPILSDGVLQGYAVHQGTIEIGEKGMYARNVRDTELFAHAVNILGDLSGQNLTLIAGANDIDAETGNVTPRTDGTKDYKISIGGAQLGSIYGDRIRMICTGEGCGVNHAGAQINAYDDFFVEAGGDVGFDGKVHVEKNLSVKSGGDTNINAPVTVNGDATFESQKNITITSGVDVAGATTLIAQKDTVIAGQDAFVSTDDNTKINAENIYIEDEAALESRGPVTVLKASLGLDIENGIVVAYHDLLMQAEDTTIDNSEVVAGDNITIEGAESGTAAESVTIIDSIVQTVKGDIDVNAVEINLTATTQDDPAPELEVPSENEEENSGNPVAHLPVFDDEDFQSFIIDLMIEEIKKKTPAFIDDVFAYWDTRPETEERDYAGVLVANAVLAGPSVLVFWSQKNQDFHTYFYESKIVINHDLKESFFPDTEVDDSEYYYISPNGWDIENILAANDITPRLNDGIFEITNDILAEIAATITENTEADWWQNPQPYNGAVSEVLLPENTKAPETQPVIPSPIESQSGTSQLIAEQGSINTQSVDFNIEGNATLYAGKDFNAVTDQFRNEGGNVLAEDNISIIGRNDDKEAERFVNDGGLLETFNGDAIIRAQKFTNMSGEEPPFERQTTLFRFKFAQTAPPLWIPHLDDMSREGYRQLWDGGRTQSHVFIPHPDYVADILAEKGLDLEDFKTNNPNYDAEYVFEVSDWDKFKPRNSAEFDPKKWSILVPDEAQHAPVGNSLNITVTEDVANDKTAQQGRIHSGGNLEIHADTITNDNAVITAAENMTLTGRRLNNIGTEALKTLAINTSYDNNTSVRETGWAVALIRRKSAVIRQDILDTATAIIAASGDIQGDFTDEITFQSNPVIPVSEDTTFDGASVDIIHQVRTATELDPSLYVNPSLFRPTVNDPDYVIETRFDFIDLDRFYGSDYFLNGVLGETFDQQDLPRRLGDSFYDTRFILDQILRQYKVKYLDPSITSNSEQVKALLDNAIEIASELGLIIGTALTEDQKRDLRKDIVWYEDYDYDGETVLVPRLYVSDATLERIGNTVGASVVSAGKSVTLSGDTITLGKGAIYAGLDAIITANDTIDINSGAIGAENVTLTAKNITVKTNVTATGNGSDHTGAIKETAATITATDTVLLRALEDIILEGAQINGSEITLSADGTVSIRALPLEHSRAITDGDVSLDIQKRLQDPTIIAALEELNIIGNDGVSIQGSELQSGGDINVYAVSGSVLLDTAETLDFSKFKSETRDHTQYTLTQLPTSLDADGNVTVRSVYGDIVLRSADIASGGNITIQTDSGKIHLLAAKNYDFESNNSNKSNAVWIKTEMKGHEIEEVVHTFLNAKGDITFRTNQEIVVNYRDTGSLDASINQLAAVPGLEWMKDLRDGKNIDCGASECPPIDWQGIAEIHNQWMETHEGLSGPAAAVIAVAIAIATQGMGAGFVGLAGNAATAAKLSTFQGILAAAANASFTSLVSQATIGLINNKGNIADTFKDLATAETVRSVAAAALTAGIMKSVNIDTGILKDGRIELNLVADLSNQIKATGINTLVDTAIRGENLSESFVNNLRFAGAALLTSQVSQEIGQAFADGQINRGVQLIAHAATGCAAGIVAGSTCGSTATAQVAGELAGLGYKKLTEDDLEKEINDLRSQGVVTNDKVLEKTFEWTARGANIAKLAGAAAAALAGADELGVQVGSESAANAAENNAFFLALIPAAFIALEAIDKGILAYDVYRAKKAFKEGDYETGNEILTSLGVGIAVEGTLGNLVPASQLLRKAGELAFKKGDKALADSFNAAAEQFNKDGVTSGQDIGFDLVLNSKNRELFNELADNGIKFSPENVVSIRKIDGKIVWLETGNNSSGLQHIYEHLSEFSKKGISQEQLPDAIFTALEKGKIVGYQGKGFKRPVYEFDFNGNLQRFAITVGDNGYIVGANPKSIPK